MEDLPLDVVQRSHDPRFASLLDNNLSAWANKKKGFSVADVRSDRIRWARDWDKGVKKTAKSASSVFMHTVRARDPSYLSRRIGSSDYEHLHNLRLEVATNSQTIRNKIQSALSRPEFSVCSPKDWFMLISTEKRRAVLAIGLESACWSCAFGQDSRAFCPDIGGSILLRRRGLELFSFINRFVDLALHQQEGTAKTDLVQNEWWPSALQLEDIPYRLHDNYKFVYDLYTLFRQDFIAHFAARSLAAVIESCIQDVERNESWIPRVILIAGPKGVQGMLAARRTLKHRVGQQCEYCECTPDEVDHTASFHFCRACKREKNIECYYCCRECQTADWPQHKLHCGKEGASRFREEDRPECKRSLSLILQMMMQGSYPDADYVLFTFHAPVGGFKVSFPRDDDMGPYFTQVRDVLTVDRNHTGLGVLAKCLVDAVAADKTASGITRENVIQQLTEEYEVDVKTPLETLEANLAMEGDENRFSGMTITKEKNMGIKRSAAC